VRKIGQIVVRQLQLRKTNRCRHRDKTRITNVGVKEVEPSTMTFFGLN
jgi:hypothetical protein